MPQIVGWLDRGGDLYAYSHVPGEALFSLAMFGDGLQERSDHLTALVRPWCGSHSNYLLRCRAHLAPPLAGFTHANQVCRFTGQK